MLPSVLQEALARMDLMCFRTFVWLFIVGVATQSGPAIGATFQFAGLLEPSSENPALFTNQVSPREFAATVTWPGNSSEYSATKGQAINREYLAPAIVADLFLDGDELVLGADAYNVWTIRNDVQLTCGEGSTVSLRDELALSFHWSGITTLTFGEDITPTRPGGFTVPPTQFELETRYSLTINMRDFSGTYLESDALVVDLNPQSFDQISVVFHASIASPYVLYEQGQPVTTWTTLTWQGNHLNVSNVPEPKTNLLLVTQLVLVGFVFRKRTKRQLTTAEK